MTRIAMPSFKQFLLLLILSLGANSAMAGKPERLLDKTLQTYESTIRWEGLARAVEYLEPSVAAKLMPPQIEFERYKHLRVTSYRVESLAPIDKLHTRQIVTIEVANIHNQEVRSIVDVQDWEYHKKQKRWWRVSALPSL